MDDLKMQDMILRALHENPNREAILVPSMFNPPIMLSNIFRLGGVLKRKGYTTPPTRRMGGWHLRLLEPGVAYCEADPSKKK
ncbi:MAG TPA: hypothetical protein VG754_10180 [Verrucomicrobiae bacterium]|nr:hypothetical protein [Verrucomicrobiae bacterium]